MTISSSRSSSRNRSWHGVDLAPECGLDLRAGPLRAMLVGPDIRYVRFGPVEIAQRIYVAVRDTAWNTIPGRMRDLEVTQKSDSFFVHFTLHHTLGGIDFEWRGSVAGTAEGILTYEMDGLPLRTFTHNKIGLNVHHPLKEYVGRPYRAHTSEGTIKGRMTSEIAPQLISGGSLTAMFPHFDELEVDLASGGTARFAFEGDHFEMQDHRNWADGNFKTYGTPLSIGYPRQAVEGQPIRQKVTLRYGGDVSAVDVDRPVHIRVGVRQHRRLPAIGLGMASHDQQLSDRESRLLRSLRPDHLRVDLHPHLGGHLAVWGRAVEAARALDCALEVALFVTSDTSGQAGELASLVKTSRVEVARVLVFEEAEGFSELRGSTDPESVRAVRAAIRTAGIDAPVAGGTNQFFNELNRTRPDTSGTDGIAYSLNPQVHAADDLSLADNLLSLADIPAFTRVICPVRVFVSPVTLVGRTGPFPAGPPDVGGLPGAVDVRQASLLGGGWTAASIKGLADGGADALTYYETTGWRGVLETESGSPRPDLFPSQGGDVFPIYHVLADVGEWKAASLLKVVSEQPNVADALMVVDPDGTHAIVANLTARLRRIAVGPLPGERVRLRILDDTTLALAVRDPEAFRARQPATQPLEGGWLNLTLAPYAIVRVDAGAAATIPTGGIK